MTSTEHDRVQQALIAQGAPASHLARMAALMTLSAASPACTALCQVGSYAQGCGDRISDLDLVALTCDAGAQEFIESVDRILRSDDLLNDHGGSHGPRGAFRKYGFLDFSSCELHACNLPTTFKLWRPYLPLWDPEGVLATCVVDGDPSRHEEFDAYPHGDDGLVWELVDCIKWLQRGKITRTKDDLRKLVAKF